MHTFVTDITLSTIWEFAQMPNLLSFDIEKFLKDNDSDELKGVEIKKIDMFSAIQNDLKPFYSVIRDFYVDNEFSFISILCTSFPIDTHSDASLRAYLTRLLTLPKEELLVGLLYSGLIKGVTIHHQPELWQRAELLAADFSELMAWLNTTDFTKETKWRILQIAQDTHGELQRYARLMAALEPIFERYYKDFQEQLPSDLENLIARLKNSGPNPFAALTDGIFDDHLLPDGELLILFSYFHPFQISINASAKTPMITWGKDIELFMALQQKARENTLNEHIRVFKNLGDKTRFQVAQLVAEGTNSTKAIADTLGVTPATISYHLSQLVNAKILKLESIDTKIQYVINQQTVADAFAAVSKLLL